MCKNTSSEILQQCIACCESSRHPRVIFFKNKFLLAMESRTLIINVKHRRQWISRGNRSTQRLRDELNPKNIRVRVEFDIQEILHKELLGWDGTAILDKQRGGRFGLQSVDWIYLRMTRSIRYLSTFCFL